MVGLSVIPLIAFAVGLCVRRSLRGWHAPEFAWWPVAAVSLAIQVALFNPPLNVQPWAMAIGPWIWVATMAAVCAVLARNGLSREPGARPLLLAAVGVALNILVVSANGGYMPQSLEARALAKPRAGTLETGNMLQNVRPLTGDTVLPWLGDVIPQPAWLPFASVVSVGDLLLSAGLALWAFGAATRTRELVGADRRSAASLVAGPR